MAAGQQEAGVFVTSTFASCPVFFDSFSRHGA